MKLGASIYRRIDGVVESRESPEGDYAGALDWEWVGAAGEHHVDGDTFSGGRRLGRWWGTPVGAANFKLKRGSAEWMY